MKIALVQLDIVWESKEANYAKAEVFVKMATREGCDVVVFPEMFNTGFSMNISAVMEDEKGETATVLSRMAKGYGINIIAGYAAKVLGEKKGVNLAVAYDRRGALSAKFSKIHPFSLSGEDQYYHAGNNVVIFNIDGVPASIFICYDLRFPEVFRIIAKEVQAIFVIANWPKTREDHWETLLKARAIENQCYVIGVNRIGTDGNGIQYSGRSHIFDPLGYDICSADEKDEFIVGELDANEVTKIRSQLPFLKDMRDSCSKAEYGD